MRRFILDTGIATLHLDRKRGVYERAAAEIVRGNRVGIAAPVLAELAFRAEGSPKRDRNLQRLRQALDVWKLWLSESSRGRGACRRARRACRRLPMLPGASPRRKEP